MFERIVTGCCCAGKRLDLFLRRNQHGEVLHQLRFSQTGSGRKLDLFLRRNQHREVLHQLRLSQARFGAVDLLLRCG